MGFGQALVGAGEFDWDGRAACECFEGGSDAAAGQNRWVDAPGDFLQLLRGLCQASGGVRQVCSQSV